MAINQKFIDDAGPHYVIDSTGQQVMINVASCDPLEAVPTVNEYMLPPWIVYLHDDIADILLAGRPGHIIENIPVTLARHIVIAANFWTRRPQDA